MDLLLDPYVRPSGALSVAEKRIFVAAFAARAIYPTAGGRVVTPILNQPVLVAENMKADVLVITAQVNSTSVAAIMLGLLGPKSPVLPGIDFTFRAGTEPLRQILLPGEKIYFVMTAINPPATHLIVTEVTP